MIIPQHSKDAKALGEFYTQQRSQFCTLGELLGEPNRGYPTGLLVVAMEGAGQFKSASQISSGKGAKAREAQMLGVNTQLIALELLALLLGPAAAPLKRDHNRGSHLVLLLTEV